MTKRKKQPQPKPNEGACVPDAELAAEWNALSAKDRAAIELKSLFNVIRSFAHRTDENDDSEVQS